MNACKKMAIPDGNRACEGNIFGYIVTWKAPKQLQLGAWV